MFDNKVIMVNVCLRHNENKEIQEALKKTADIINATNMKEHVLAGGKIESNQLSNIR